MSEDTGQTVKASLQPQPCLALSSDQTSQTLPANIVQTPDCFLSETKENPLKNGSSETVRRYEITPFAEPHISSASSDSDTDLEFKDCVDFVDESALFVNKSSQEEVQTLTPLLESHTNMGNQSSSKTTDSPGQESETATCCQVKPRKLRKRSTSVEESEPRAVSAEKDGAVDGAGEIKHNYIVLDAKARIRLSADFDVITPEGDDEKKETEKSFEFEPETVPGPRISSGEKEVSREQVKEIDKMQDKMQNKGDDSILQEETKRKHVTDAYDSNRIENKNDKPRLNERKKEKKGEYRFQKRGGVPEEATSQKTEIQEGSKADRDLYHGSSKGDEKSQKKSPKRKNLNLNLERYAEADAHSSSEGYVTPDLDISSLTRQDLQTGKTSGLGSRGTTSPITCEFKDVEDSGNVPELLIPDDTVVDTEEHMLIDVNQIITDFKKAHATEANTNQIFDENYFKVDKTPTLLAPNIKPSSKSEPIEVRDDAAGKTTCVIEDSVNVTAGVIPQISDKKSEDISDRPMHVSKQNEVPSTSLKGPTSVTDQTSWSPLLLQSSEENAIVDNLHDSESCVMPSVKRLTEIASERLAKDSKPSSRELNHIPPGHSAVVSGDEKLNILPPPDFQDSIDGFDGKDPGSFSDDMLYGSGKNTEETVYYSKEKPSSSIADIKQSELSSYDQTNEDAFENEKHQTQEIQEKCQKKDADSLKVPNNIAGSVTPVEEHVPPPSPSAFDILEEDEEEEENEISIEDKRKSEEIVEFGTDVCKRLSQLLDEECIFVDSESDEEVVITDTTNDYVIDASAHYQQEANPDTEKIETYVKDVTDKHECVDARVQGSTANGKMHSKSTRDVAKELVLRRQQLTRSSTTDSTDSIERELKAIYQPKDQGSLPKRDSEILCDVLDAYADDHVDAPECVHNVGTHPKKQTSDSGEKPKILKIPTLEETWPGTVPPQILDEIQDRTPTMEAHPERTPLPELACADVSSAVCQTSGRRSVTCTESDLDISEQRTDHSTDSMLADDEYEETMEILFSKTYTEPAEGGEAFVSCTVVNSSFKEPSQEDLWMKYASEEALKLLEGSPSDVMSSAFLKAKKEMKDIHEHLVSLKQQMEHFHDDIEKRHCTDVDYLSPDYSSGRRAITD